MKRKMGGWKKRIGWWQILLGMKNLPPQKITQQPTERIICENHHHTIVVCCYSTTPPPPARTFTAATCNDNTPRKHRCNKTYKRGCWLERITPHGAMRELVEASLETSARWCAGYVCTWYDVLHRCAVDAASKRFSFCPPFDHQKSTKPAVFWVQEYNWELIF